MALSEPGELPRSGRRSRIAKGRVRDAGFSLAARWRYEADCHGALGRSSASRGVHTILDLGADEFTVGRLHPMIDQDLRSRRLRQEAADPEVGMILLDVVLGEGAHADPAGELAPVDLSRSRRARSLVIVIGTDEDPQGLTVQIETLEKAGARVFRTVDEAVEWIFLHRKRRWRRTASCPVPSIVQGPVRRSTSASSRSTPACGARGLVGPGGLAAAGRRQREARPASWRMKDEG